jgi:hypothetical protein
MSEERKQLEANVAAAEVALKAAQDALTAFVARPENWRFDSVDDAGKLEIALLDLAHNDCEGSYNFGADEYRQQCYIGDKLYVAILTVEYGRHDKTYYYVDGHEFRIEEVTP